LAPISSDGSDLVAACAAAGTDYLDLSGEPTWMHAMIGAHEAAAKASGARIVFSCGFDSIPFELGVLYTQGLAKAKFGHPVARVKGRVRNMRGGLSGGTAASGKATMAAMQKDPSLMGVMMSPFALTPGFQGPAQPTGTQKEVDPDLGLEVGPFMMAVINTKNVHRSNLLQGHAYGTDFVYDEMSVTAPGSSTEFTDLGGAGGPQPGKAPARKSAKTASMIWSSSAWTPVAARCAGRSTGTRTRAMARPPRSSPSRPSAWSRTAPRSPAGSGFPARPWVRG